MEKRKYLHAFVAVCRNCQGEGIKVTYDMADTLKQRPGVRKACPVCEGSGMVKISGVQVLTIVPARPLTLHETVKEEIDTLSVRDLVNKADEEMKRRLDVVTSQEDIAGQARNDTDISDSRRGAWSVAPKPYLDPKEDINHSEFNGDMSFVLFK